MPPPPSPSRGFGHGGPAAPPLLLRRLLIGCAAWLPRGVARIVGAPHSVLRPGAASRYTEINRDPEPLELFNDAGLWPSDNPKNGTPWYRMKKVSEQGQNTHRHFRGLTATGDFARDILHAHNAVRERAGIAGISWSGALEAMARDRVQKLAHEGCYIRHSPLHQRWEEAGFQYVGENLYKVINMAPTGVDIVDAWYAELEDYNYGSVGADCTKSRCASRASPPCMLGHFTQVMWAETTDVGCAIAECPNQEKRTFVSVCNYGPGGNIVGRLPFSASCSEGLGLSNKACDSVDHTVPAPGVPPARSLASSRQVATGLASSGALAVASAASVAI